MGFIHKVQFAPFDVGEKAMSEKENIVTQCISRDTKGNEIGQWKNESIRATVYYELLDDIIDGPWGGNSVKAISERCVYAISDMSMAVSQLKSCVKPIGRQKTVPARLVNP